MIRISLLLFALGWVISSISQPAKPNINTKGIAVQGYDVVAYFESNKAVKGSAQYAVSYQGAVYYFATDAHKQAFKAKPANYAPQYGGWCAYAMGKYGGLVEVDPETFKVTDGKLYLFYNKLLNNTLPLWNKDESKLRTAADATWVKKYQGSL